VPSYQARVAVWAWHCSLSRSIEIQTVVTGYLRPEPAAAEEARYAAGSLRKSN
jgi:hypothetical protein